jgi:TonB family protein
LGDSAMLRRAFAYFALGTSLVSATFAAAAPPAAMLRSPTANWVVDFDESQCIASRNYGTSAEPWLLGLKAPLRGDVMQVMVVRPGVGAAFSDQHITVMTLDNAQVLRTSALSLSIPEKKQHLLRMILSSDQFDRFAKASAVSIDVRGQLRQTIALKDMPALTKVMADCVAGLRKHWNAGLTAGTPSPSLRQEATGDLRGLFSSKDYPDVGILDDSQGSSSVVLLVDETGKVADCTITASSGSAALDGQACYAITTRAKFKPAIGVDGKPAKSVFLQQISWRMRD